MKVRWSQIVYGLIVNLAVCFFLCLTSSLAAATDFENGIIQIDLKEINWINLLINFLVGYAIDNLVGIIIPFVSIGKWFTGLFHIKNDTYTNNMPYRLLAILSSTIIYWAILSPSLMILNVYILNMMSIKEGLFSLLLNAPIMLLVGYITTLLNDIAGYKVAHKIDKDF
jgi:hypothetical protein